MDIKEKNFIVVPEHIKNGKVIKQYVKRIQNLTEDEQDLIQEKKNENSKLEK